jgi:photosystem II stability/assembly factor-like uncharacterized protein
MVLSILLAVAGASPMLAEVRQTVLWSGRGLGGVRTLVADPVNPGTVYAIADGSDPARNAIFKSTDRGGHWESLRDAPLDHLFAALAVHSVFSSRLYAVANPLSGAGAPSLLESRDGGESWTFLDSSISAVSPLGLAADPTDPSVLYFGTTVTLPIYGSNTSCLLGRIPCPLLYIESKTTISRSNILNNKSSSNVIEYTTEGSASPVDRIVVSAENPAVVYALTARALTKSLDAGGSWSDVYRAGLCRVAGLAVDPHNPERAYVGFAFGSRVMTNPYSDPNGSPCSKPGILRTLDGGLTFVLRNLPNGEDGITVQAIEVDPARPDTVFVAFLRKTAEGAVPTLPEIVMSRDGGETWASLNWPEPFGVNGIAVDASGVFLYAATQKGVFVTAIAPVRGTTTLPFR